MALSLSLLVRLYIYNVFCFPFLVKSRQWVPTVIYGKFGYLRAEKHTTEVSEVNEVLMLDIVFIYQFSFLFLGPDFPNSYLRRSAFQ